MILIKSFKFEFQFPLLSMGTISISFLSLKTKKTYVKKYICLYLSIYLDINLKNKKISLIKCKSN